MDLIGLPQFRSVMVFSLLMHLCQQFLPKVFAPQVPAPLNPFELDNVRIVPELADKVSSSGPVTLYFVLYPAKDAAGANANVTLQILRDGTQISREPLKVPGPRPDGSIPMVVRVSPGQGSYALIVTAQQGKLIAESSRSLDIQ